MRFNMASKKKYPSLSPSQRSALTRQHEAIRADGRKRRQSKATIGSRVSWATRKANLKAAA